MDYISAVQDLADQAAALLCLLSVGLAVVMIDRRRKRFGNAEAAFSLLQRREHRLAELIRVLRMAEELAGLGIWQYFPDEDRQEWSAGMQRLFGIEEGETMMPGDAETILATSGLDLVSLVMGDENHAPRDHARIEIHMLDGQLRTLSLQACTVPGGAGRQRRIIAVIVDVSEQTRREDQLRRSRTTALQEAREAREIANRDALTDLANRRGLMAQLDRMLLERKQGGEPFSVIIFDIDHFKQVNDSYGHPAGDEVLRRIARITCEQSREGDIVGRIGGEEFAWLVRGADQNFARIISERLRQAIALRSGTSKVPAVTVSIGFVTAEQNDTTLSLFARADEALYEAKHAGRNTIRMAA